MTNAASIKARLNNKARSGKKNFQEVLIAYGLERSIYRLSVSEYAENFILKGGVFLYALFECEFTRATSDIDLLAKNISNDITEIGEVFKKIFSIECDDAIQYDLKTIKVKSITEFKEYHGVNVSVFAYLDRTRIPVSVDIGFGDIICPDKVKMIFPVLLDMEQPEIYAYSISSVVAEKFEAIVSLGDANSRYKDFYDIYMLAGRYDIDGMELSESMRETFAHRGTGFEDMYALTAAFSESKIHQRRWMAFLNKKKAMVNVEFEAVIVLLRTFLLPVVDSILEGREYLLKWDSNLQKWDEQ
jgi:domain of hypothetical function DUF1814 (fragment)